MKLEQLHKQNNINMQIFLQGTYYKDGDTVLLNIMPMFALFDGHRRITPYITPPNEKLKGPIEEPFTPILTLPVFKLIAQSKETIKTILSQYITKGVNKPRLELVITSDALTFRRKEVINTLENKEHINEFKDMMSPDSDIIEMLADDIMEHTAYVRKEDENGSFA